MSAHARIAFLTDPASFAEAAGEVRSADPLTFFDLKPYRERLAEAELNTHLTDAMVVGSGTLDGLPLELAVMDFSFLGGSMGSAVGEKFVRAADSAIANGTPLLLVTGSGGARMQEGILSLMQLPKVISSIDELHDDRLPLFCLLTDPTTGGAMASFATLGDVVVAEPGALLAFTGPRVVQELVKEKLSDDFGRAEQNLRFGQIDAIVPRPEQRAYLARLLRLFER
jgi:acetyl-CoA carboxylase carboxyl transferase subunit beta